MFERLDEVRVTQCYFPQHGQDEIVDLQLHIFADASEEAYACVAYFRVEFVNGIEMALIGGKAKVPEEEQITPQ